MPRYPNNTIGLKVSKESLIGATLRDRPVAVRNYYGQEKMVALLQRLQAAEEWARALNASPGGTMLVAASLDLGRVAYVFDDLATACHEAAPPHEDQPVTADAVRAWVTAAASNHKALDRLVHAMFLLGEHVMGCWTWQPPGHAINPDGSLDESIPWELEYCPPPDDVGELIATLRLRQDKENSWARFSDDAARTYRKLQRLAVSAVADASSNLTDVVVPGDAVGFQGSAVPHTEAARARHEQLVAVIAEIGRSAEGDSELAAGWWRQVHDELVDASWSWMAEVPPTLSVGNVGRQAIKKKASGWVGYVLQYAGLLRGNAAAFELVQMTSYLIGICSTMQVKLKAEQVTAPRSQRICDEVRAAYCRALVSASVEDRWRRRMGDEAEKVGAMIIEIVGHRGQLVALKKESLVAAADRAGLVTATTKKSRDEAVGALLVRMQGCGLAACMPVTVFRKFDMNTPRNNAKARRCIHAARDWWFNPLGAVLAAPKRSDSPSAS